MAEYIPFIPSANNYQLRVPLPSATVTELVVFDTRWNAHDHVDPDTGEWRGAWYFDLYDASDNVIALGIKVVLGTPRLGRACDHPFFGRHILQVIDTTNSGRDAGFDDLGGRVVVMHMTAEEFRRSA